MNKCETLHPRPSGSENQDHRCCLLKLFIATGTCSQAQRFWVSFQISCNQNYSYWNQQVGLARVVEPPSDQANCASDTSDIYKEASIPLIVLPNRRFLVPVFFVGSDPFLDIRLWDALIPAEADQSHAR
jgi:hypothetical protein